MKVLEIRGSTLLLGSFLVLLAAVERCHGSRADVRQQLRSEVVYSERNHKEGRYKYGYAVKKGESQFHHQRSLDGAMYGCYGYVDPQGKLFITHYLADMAGYRLINMANPDRKLAERVRNLGTPENPVDLQHLFPAECQEDGDIKTLQETANAMKASLAESGVQNSSYRSRSSATGGYESTVQGSLASVKGATRFESIQQQQGFSETSGTVVKTHSTSDGVRSVSTVGASKSQDSKLLSNIESNTDLLRSNMNRASTKITVGTLAAAEPKFVMKSNSKDSSVRFTASDSGRSSTLKNTGGEQTFVESSATEFQDSVEKTKSVVTDNVVQTSNTGGTGSSVAKQIAGEHQLIGNKDKLTSTGSLRESEESDFNKSTQSIASVSVVEENKKIPPAYKVSSTEGEITESSSKLTNAGGSTQASKADSTKVTFEVKENSEKQITGDLHSTKGTAVVEKAVEYNTHSKEFESITAGNKVADSNVAETMTTSQSGVNTANGSKINVVADTRKSEVFSLKEATESTKKTEEVKSKKQSIKTSTTLKMSDSDIIKANEMNVPNREITKDQQVILVGSKHSSKISLKQEPTGTSATLNTASVEEKQLATSLEGNGTQFEILGEVDQVQEDNFVRAGSIGVKTVDREFLSIGQAAKSELTSDVKEHVENFRSPQSAVEDDTSASKGGFTNDSSRGTTKVASTSDVWKLNKGNLLKKDSMGSGSIAVKHEQTSSVKNTDNIRPKIDGSTQISGNSEAEHQFRTRASASITDATISSTKTAERFSPATAEQMDTEEHETKTTVLVRNGPVSNDDLSAAAKEASQTNKNVQGQSIKAALTTSDASNFAEINLRFDDGEAEQPSKVDSNESSGTKTNQETFSGRSNSATYRGTVKYADYATENEQTSDRSKGTTGDRLVEVKRKSQRSKARVQQETQASLEHNRGDSRHRLQAGSVEVAASKGVVTIAEYVKDSSSNDASEQVIVKDDTQAGSVKQSTDTSTKHRGVLVESGTKAGSELEHGIDKQKVKVSENQKIDSMNNKELSSVTGYKQTESVLANQKLMSKQNYDSINPAVKVFTDHNINHDRNVDKESSVAKEVSRVEASFKQNKDIDSNKGSSRSKVVQTQRSSEASSGRSFNQAKSEQIVQQVKEISKDSTPIIRFAIPGIIQQGPPIQGRRNFVGIPNLNDLFPRNSQSRVGAVPVSEEDNPRLEVPRLPATPRTTTPASPDAVTVTYQLPRGTDRTPVSPRPTTSFRPIAPGFPATTAKSVISRTTVGPSGDIYDEIEEELDLGSRPTLMSPQIPEQKPPITSSGGVTVIPSISQGVAVEQSGTSHCYEVTLQIPSDAKQIFVQTNSPAFRVFGDGDPNERIRLVEPGVYEVNLGATSGIQFNRYQAGEDPWKRSNKLHLDMDRSFDYGELVQKPLYSRTQSGQHDTTTTGGDVNQARLNNPYLPLAPSVAPVEARNAGGAEEQVLTPEQRSLLSLVPSWKKVLLYY